MTGPGRRGYIDDMLLLPSLLALACTPKTPAGDDTAPVRSPGTDQAITAFDQEYLYYSDAENRRQVDVQVDFPDSSTTYSAITGHFRLDCPHDLCDWWDRYGTFGIVLGPGTADERYVELDRFITAYRVGYGWDADLTALRPLLTGTQTLRVFVDTWVGEGSSNGDGWLFTATMDFTGGDPPSPEPVAVEPVWGHLSWNAGRDDQPVESQVVPQTVELPTDLSQVTFRSFITGHGWDNTQNCAEFCAKTHYFEVAGTELSRQVWRDDCNQTATDGVQQGTWKYDRAGWCPGAAVLPWDSDVTAAVAAGGPVDLSYHLEDFSWAGDGDQPYYYVSGLLLKYR